MARKVVHNGKGHELGKTDTAALVERYSAQYRKFVNVELNARDKEEFITWASANDFYDVMERHATLGRTIGVKRDFKMSCFIASSMERDSQSANAGCIVTARASKPDLALWRLLYILDVVLGEDRWENLVDISGDIW